MLCWVEYVKLLVKSGRYNSPLYADVSGVCVAVGYTAEAHGTMKNTTDVNMPSLHAAHVVRVQSQNIISCRRERMYGTTVDCTAGGEPFSLAPAAAVAAQWTKAVFLYGSGCFSPLQGPSLV
jgi:hypothetical protein